MAQTDVFLLAKLALKRDGITLESPPLLLPRDFASEREPGNLSGGGPCGPGD